MANMGVDDPASSEEPPRSSAPFPKPLIDKLDYRIVTLPNSLKAVLVSDPETDKAAAALDVNVGNMSDPLEVLGLAHFTEHMLFYSSEKYPVEDDYSKFVVEHGGHTNAFTASENTNYQFDINHDHLEPALDRFAQFFICPLISEDGVDREIKAVDAEHGKNLNTDAWRQMQLHKHTCNPAHPWSKFQTGNIETLGDRPRAAGLKPRQCVVDFHSQHYSSSLMRLAVYGRQTLDELEAMVREKFSAVPDSGATVPKFGADVFTSDQLGKLLKVVPQKEGHALEMAWQVPASQPLYRKAPLHYISHLLGHEGSGSVFALLKARGWASSLVAGESGSSISSRSFFSVRVELTEEGHKNVQEVCATVFRYLAILRGEGGITYERFQEMQALEQLRFNFRDKQAPYSYVTSLAMGMQQYMDHELLQGMYGVPLEYEQACIREALNEMVARNMRLTWVSKTLLPDTNLVEPIYGTHYSMEDLPQEWLAIWECPDPDNSLHLPEPNLFIPSDFTLYPEEPGAPQEPVVVAESDLMRLYHRPAPSFESPKAVIYLDFQCPEAYTSPENAVMTRLFVKLLSDYLNEIAYPAELAGLYYVVNNTQYGFQVVVSGYNHKLRKLLEAIMERIVGFEVKEDRLALMVEQLGKEYANIKYQQPYQWAIYLAEVVCSVRHWRVDEYQAVLPDVTAGALSDFFKRLVGRCFVEGLAIGNITVAEVLELEFWLRGLLQRQLGTRPPFPSQAKDIRCVRLPSGVTSVLEEPGPNPGNDNSAVLAVYQVGPVGSSPSELRPAVLAELLVHLGKRAAFHQLRTVEQLGYIVSMVHMRDSGVATVAFVLQSNQHAATHMEGRVESFIAGYEFGVSDEELAAAVEELAKGKLEKPKKLTELAQRHWGEIFKPTLLFNRQECEVAVLRTVTCDEVRKFASEVLTGADSRRKLVIRVVGTPAAAATTPAAGDGDAAGTDAPTEPRQEAAGDGCEGVGTDAPAEQRQEKTGDEGEASGGTGDAAADSGTADVAVAAEAPAAVPVVAPRPEVHITDVWKFKRSCEVYPAVGRR